MKFKSFIYILFAIVFLFLCKVFLENFISNYVGKLIKEKYSSTNNISYSEINSNIIPLCVDIENFKSNNKSVNISADNIKLNVNLLNVFEYIFTQKVEKFKGFELELNNYSYLNKVSDKLLKGKYFNINLVTNIFLSETVEFDNIDVRDIKKIDVIFKKSELKDYSDKVKVSLFPYNLGLFDCSFNIKPSKKKSFFKISDFYFNSEVLKCTGNSELNYIGKTLSDFRPVSYYLNYNMNSKKPLNIMNSNDFGLFKFGSFSSSFKGLVLLNKKYEFKSISNNSDFELDINDCNIYFNKKFKNKISTFPLSLIFSNYNSILFPEVKLFFNTRDNKIIISDTYLKSDIGKFIIDGSLLLNKQNFKYSKFIDNEFIITELSDNIKSNLQTLKMLFNLSSINSNGDIVLKLTGTLANPHLDF